MHGKVIQKCPYMGKIISVIKKHFVDGHHGHPAMRTITVRSYMNKDISALLKIKTQFLCMKVLIHPVYVRIVLCYSYVNGR